MYISGTFEVIRNTFDVSAQKGMESWRRDTFEYFGTWDDCWARVHGAYIDDRGEELHKVM